MKKSILLTIMVICCSFSTVSMADPKTYFINGMNTGREDAIEQLDQLSIRMKERYPYEDYNFELLLNDTYGGWDSLQRDGGESFLQWSNLDDFSLAMSLIVHGPAEAFQENLKDFVDNNRSRRNTQIDKIIMKLAETYIFEDTDGRQYIIDDIQSLYSYCSPLVSGQGSTECIPNITLLGGTSTLDKILSEFEKAQLAGIVGLENGVLAISDAIGYFYRNIPDYRDTIEYRDYTTMISIIDKHLNASPSNTANVVAYSQGNLFANKVLDEIGDTQNTRMLSIGTPDNHVFGDGEYVQLKEDIPMSYIPGSLPGNYTNKPFFDLGYGVSNVDGDPKGHSFIDAYLKGDVSRNAITSLVNYNFQTLYYSQFASTDPSFGIIPRPDLPKLDPSDQTKFVTTQDNVYLRDAYSGLSQAMVGESFQVGAKQYFSGSSSSSTLGSIRLGYYLSRDDKLDGGDVLLNTDYSSIGSNDSYDSERDPVTIPMGVSPGDYHILIVADDNQNVIETQESDNIASFPLEVISDVQNDMYVSSTSLSNITEESVYAYARHYYSGDLTTSEIGTSYLGYYLSTDATLSSDDILLYRDPSSIGSNDSYDSERETLNLPSNLQDNRYYYILFVANDTEVVTEYDRSNNVSSERFLHKKSSVSGSHDIYLSKARVSKQSNGQYYAYV
ncbi:hypothetical protein MK079_04870, partial [Candidatus Gracilibacteria bacterium]|nr:hypothetical protein [Candidatus Gracilibacteria bacterium]